ncbi:tyrosyl-tRNA synthetase domain protein, partial [Chlamydia psittaci 84-8471/1]
KLVLRLI